MNTLTVIEWAGTVTGIACVALQARARIEAWPIGIVSVVLYAWFFWQIKLYADAGLQVFYLVTGFYGWWHWTHGGAQASAAPITTLDNGTRITIVVVAGIAAYGIGRFLSGTDASLPYWDAFTTTFAVAGQLLLMRKVFENWAIWIVVDTVAIGVYYVKEAYVTCGLYAVFLGIAVWGLLHWRALLREQATTAAPATVDAPA